MLAHVFQYLCGLCTSLTGSSLVSDRIESSFAAKEWFRVGELNRKMSAVNTTSSSHCLNNTDDDWRIDRLKSILLCETYWNSEAIKPRSEVSLTWRLQEDLTLSSWSLLVDRWQWMRLAFVPKLPRLSLHNPRFYGRMWLARPFALE